MPTEEQLQQGFRFGDWDILPGKGVFRCGDREVRPEPKVFAVLLALAKRDRVLVSKQELIDEVWEGRPTGDEPITRCLSQLRRHLDDRERPYRLIETLQRRGYRLMEPVHLHEPPAAETAELSEAEPASGGRKWKLISVVLLAACAAIIAVLWPSSELPTVPPPPRSIAVLPFENMTEQVSDAYIVSGLKVSLVQALHQTDDTVVRNSRVRYEMEQDEIAELLGVENVLTGSLQRNGDHLIVAYEVSKDGRITHSGTVDGLMTDLFGLQENLATSVRVDLGYTLTPSLITGHRPESEAYDNYMRGRYALERRGDLGNLESAIDLFQRAIQRDANYGPTYLALATAYLLMPDYRNAPLAEMSRLALEVIETGIDADPAIADAAGAIYGFIYHQEKRWLESEAAYQRAVNAKVVDSNSFNWYSRMLSSVGRKQDALDQALRALEIDPSSAVINSRVAISQTWLDNNEEANEFYVRANELGASGANHTLAYAFLLAREGRMDVAKDVATVGIQSAGLPTDWIEPVFAALEESSRIPDALLALDAAARSDAVPPQVDLIIRVLFGDVDGAMRIARKLELPGEFFEMDLLFVTELKPLRDHPDFLPLLERLGVVQYWRNTGCEYRDDQLRCSDP